MEYVFPTEGYEGQAGKQPPKRGMTLRDYFAGQALMGLMNNAEKRIEVDLSSKTNAEILADNCYFMADAMLKARNP